MTDCANETVLQAWLDRELSPAASDAFRSHVAGCDRCAARVREAEEALFLIGTACHSAEPVPTVRLRSRIEDGLAAAPPAGGVGHSALFSPWGVAAAAVLVVGILGALVGGPVLNAPEPEPAREPVGEMPPRTPVSPLAALTPGDGPGSARRATWLESQTSRHLEQAQLVLRSVRNSQALSASELHYERALSRELVIRNRLLRRRAQQKEDAAAEEVLVQVEPLLVDIANLPDHAAAGDIAALQSLIRTQGIIVELRLYASLNGA
jgi:hypothetical protein